MHNYLHFKHIGDFIGDIGDYLKDGQEKRQ